MLVYAVDLGTTNLKVVLYDERARQLAVSRRPMDYRRDGSTVEFDPEAVFDTVLALITECARQAGPPADSRAAISLTGQAEATVLTGADDRSLVPGLSWMDERATQEAEEIAARFSAAEAFAITGQPEASATWPAAKLRWFAKHRPEVLRTTRRVLMIKDYVLLRLTGSTVGEETTRGFTYWTDVREGAYWGEMLTFCGVDPDQLPPIVPAGTDIGPVLPEVVAHLPAATSYTVNAGALDHFSALLGLGAYDAGTVGVSAGTVLALSRLATDWTFDAQHRVSFHAGLRSDDIVQFSCADSGGISLEWFRERIAGGISYGDLEPQLSSRDRTDAPLFLPYLTGINPPDFNSDARGAFVDLQVQHDRADLAFAVMEGVAHLLRRNIEDLAVDGQTIDRMVSAGGGTSSDFWNQLKADACGITLAVAEEPEDACRGAALLALVAAGYTPAIDALTSFSTPNVRSFVPSDSAHRSQRYEQFEAALGCLYPQNLPHHASRES
ncbi:FGGY-family carbohydrate kinase [Leucobacter musarum]|uniref:FGGY-family carbohydrate kinase n=1 Tax=Leucobacter musarum TaxID=1930747 RepID=UPI0006A78476|nr:FGGY family carbohydrate kinase [Leucobacter musarum]